MEYNDAEKILSIVKKTVAPVKGRNVDVDLAVTEDIIFNKIPAALKENAPMNFPELYFSFTEEYERFKQFLIFEPLIGKRIVALGGGFSSGKSSFVNSLLGKTSVNAKGREKLVRFLPTESDPTTSVPTYIVSSQNEEAYGINLFNNKIKYELDDIKPISHGFGRTENDSEAIKLGQLLKTLFIASPLQQFENIAFLDTPGYSKPDTESFSEKTDERIALEQLSSADNIIWFIPARAGTFPESDIKFIQRLHNKKAKLIFIITSADSKTDDDLKGVLAEIASVARSKNIAHEGIYAVSNKAAYRDAYDKKKVIEHLQRWNVPISEQNFAYNFSILFIKCRDYLNKELNEEKLRLDKLNRSSLIAENSDVSAMINDLLRQSRKRIEQLKKMLEELEKLRGEFFAEIKRISSVIGIDLPEADEIELAYSAAENSEGPAKTAENLCTKNGSNYSSIEKLLLSYIWEMEDEAAEGSPLESGGLAHEEQIFDMLCREFGLST